MIPEKPRPKALATANNPTSSRVSRKAAVASICSAEPAITVRNPPNRSAKAPQNCREMNAQANITDSIAAPWLGLIPTSPQNATRCEAGMAIGTQQQKLVMQISTIARLRCSPSTRSPGRGPA